MIIYILNKYINVFLIGDSAGDINNILELIDGYVLNFSSTVYNGTSLSCNLTLDKNESNLGTKTFSGNVYGLTYTNPIFSIQDGNHTITVNLGYSASTGYGNFSFQYAVDNVEIETFTCTGGEYASKTGTYNFPIVLFYNDTMYKQVT